MRTKINGKEFECQPSPTETAIEVIREHAGLTGTKMACGGGSCGACTVLVDGVPTVSCLMPANHMQDKEIQTIESHGRENLHPVQRAFMANDGLQCGFCTPGFVNEGIAFYNTWRETKGKTEPSQHEIAVAMSGHLCRCAAYVGIYEAIAQACRGDFDEVTELRAPRVDALEKVTGEAKYTVDIKWEGQLEGVILRSKHPHAIIKSVDSTAAKALEGVVAVADLLEGEERVRWVGQPIVGVVAKDLATAEAALKLIKVDYEVLPHVIGMDQAMAEGAPEVYGDSKEKIPSAAEGMSLPITWNGNVTTGKIKASSWFPPLARKAVDTARQKHPENLVEQTFYNHQQVHSALEPHAAVARWEGEQKLHVAASSQAIRVVRSQLAKFFQLDKENVHVESEHIGGGFGGKQGLYNEIKAAALLARVAKAPVRVVANRLEELSYVGLRPASRNHGALVTGEQGEPKAITLTAYGDAGVATGTMAATLYGFMSPKVHKDFEEHQVVNNTNFGMPLRGPDAPSSFFTMDQLIDQAAHERGISPTEIRRRWYPKDEIRQRLYDWADGIPEWKNRGAVASGTGRFRRGIGLSSASWMFIYNPDSKVTLSSSPEGIKVSTATQDIGNGTRTSIAKAIEDVLGISRHEVMVDIGHSDRPIGPVTGGSQVTATIYPCTFKCAQELKYHLTKEAKKMGLKNARAAEGGVDHDGGFTSWQDILKEAEPFTHTDSRGAEKGPFGLKINTSSNEEAPGVGLRLAHSAMLIEVEIDTRLGKVRPIQAWSGIAAGKIHVRELAESQAYSGIIQGLGYALYEQKTYDPHNGHTLTSNLNDYHIPGIGDTPKIHVHFDEEGFEQVRNQGIGMSELATVGVAAAVANAVYHATGWRPLETPMTPQKVMAGLAGLEEQSVPTKEDLKQEEVTHAQ